jgi:hypothetical protein
MGSEASGLDFVRGAAEFLAEIGVGDGDQAAGAFRE